MAYQTQPSTSAGVTDVTILAAPAASTSRTVPAGGICIANSDTAVILVTLQMKIGAVDYPLYPIIEIQPDDNWTNQRSVHCLDATDRILEIFLAGAVAATEAKITVVYRDEVQA